MKCQACGLHALRYAICDRWDCPNVLLRLAIAGESDELDDVNSDPDAEDRDPEDDTIGFPGDEMADWPLEDEDYEDEEDD